MALTSVKTLNSDCNSAPMLKKSRGELCKDKFFLAGFSLYKSLNLIINNYRTFEQST